MTPATSDYRPMWSALGLDLDKHDALLNGLGQAYQSLFLDRPHRPSAMQYFDFVMSEVHGLRIQELLDAKRAGRKVIGSFCVFVPEELILAVDGVSVGLCAGAEFGFEAAERHLPRSTCALIKSFFGFTLEKVCPYIAACDVVVGENTCDGKKKAYESFAALVSDLYVLDLPQTKSVEGRALLAAEYRRFAGKLEEVSGRTITVDSLRAGIETVEAKRSAMKRLSALRRAVPAPIAGLDALLIEQVFFYDDPARFTGSVHAVCDELEERISRVAGVAPAKTPRLVVSGCPMAVPNWKLPAIVEGCGAVIVAEESCVGERGTQSSVAAAGETVEALIDALVERYLSIDCAIFTPNPTRIEHIRRLVRERRADGVVHYGLQFCSPYQIESANVERELEEEGIPVLRVDTDYSEEDVEQLRTRVEAFVERLRG